MLISCNRLPFDALPRPAATLPLLLPEDDLLLLLMLLLMPDDLERDPSPGREEEGNLPEPREPCDPRLLDIATDSLCRRDTRTTRAAQHTAKQRLRPVEKNGGRVGRKQKV